MQAAEITQKVPPQADHNFVEIVLEKDCDVAQNVAKNLQLSIKIMDNLIKSKAHKIQAVSDPNI
jgi:hypothetical protein